MSLATNPHAAAILDALAPLEGLSQPIGVGDGVAPLSGDGVLAPCAVLHLRPGGQWFDSVGAYATDGIMPFQITCVGITAAQARIVADKVATYLEGADLDVDSRAVYRVRRRSGPSGTAERDDTLTPPLFYLTVQYQLLSAAAA